MWAQQQLVVDGAPTFTLGTLVVSHVKHHITAAASRSESAKTGWPRGGSCGAEAVAVHGGAAVEQPERCPAELTRRSATLTLATPAVSHTERPVTMAAGRPESAETGWQRGGSSDAPAEPRQRVHGRRSHGTKEPRALLRCAALAELTHHLDLDLAKRSGACRS